MTFILYEKRPARFGKLFVLYTTDYEFDDDEDED
jgi:hypothetical protein